MKKPTKEDLFAQIEEWRQRTLMELKFHDRMIEAKNRAADIFQNNTCSCGSPLIDKEICLDCRI